LRRLLQEFYESQNAKSPKSVNATYLVTGVRKPEVEAAENVVEEQNGHESEDQMQVDDTPIPSFLVEQPPDSTPEVVAEDEDVAITTMMIINEEELEGKSGRVSETKLMCGRCKEGFCESHIDSGLQHSTKHAESKYLECLLTFLFWRW
jgi:DNA polymerase subunit Cdc27